jgi:two-component system alkaline phosphatase synthesis response regulator PhoP
LVEDAQDQAAGGRILVAEDDEISASILVHKLKKEGLDVVRYHNGEEACKAAMERVPDLVILDVKMPGLDGFEVLDRLRKDSRFSKTPIVMLTSMGQEADVVRGFSLGADDYVLKPFSPVELAARVRRLLKRGRSARVG